MAEGEYIGLGRDPLIPFKAGDRVICRDPCDSDDNLTFGYEYTVEAVSKSLSQLWLKEKKGNWAATRFSLVAPEDEDDGVETVVAGCNDWLDSIGHQEVAEFLEDRTPLNVLHAGPKITAVQEAAVANLLVAADNGQITEADVVTLPHHYTRFKIEPIRFIIENNLNFHQANIIKYILRYDAKNGLEDLKKARRMLDMFIAWVEGDANWWKVNRKELKAA
ncbi:hypothetical protein M2322_002681 [Rhodoblastus acidophilus]|uniref:DUF3310 domain-containing protein n=1 Tax=Rhodoblastus acidophilus TaxID=1074 RepID=UPI002224B258|nr:DUF3310 domain-containing protein [Rhodoblastus acidophilus]MCW2317127.1 hypothetical protein [Rhodoblastus acidophilus]